MIEMMKWLEPSISRSVESVIDLCDEAARPIDNEFKAAIQYLSRRHPELTDLLTEIQDIHFNRQAIIERAYRNGFLDGVKLVKKMGPECQFQTHDYPQTSHK